MPITPSTLTTPYDFASQLLSTCATALATSSGGPIARSFVSVGLPAFDCEQLTVCALTLGWEGSGQLGQGVMSAERRIVRGRINLLGFAIIVIRDCQPVVAGANTLAPPTVAQLDAAASILLQDMWSIWHQIDNDFNSGLLFEGQCSLLAMDSAAAINASGTMGGWQINLRTQIDGIPT